MIKIATVKREVLNESLLSPSSSDQILFIAMCSHHSLSLAQVEEITAAASPLQSASFVAKGRALIRLAQLQIPLLKIFPFLNLAVSLNYSLIR